VDTETETAWEKLGKFGRKWEKSVIAKQKNKDEREWSELYGGWC